MSSDQTQKNVDINSLTSEEQKLYRLYGRLPQRKDFLVQKLKQGRKYFDSGDYALSKAGKASDTGITNVGKGIPSPETIPHLAPSASPKKDAAAASAHRKRRSDASAKEAAAGSLAFAPSPTPSSTVSSGEQTPTQRKNGN
ncbi:endosulphine family protein [Schizosaccharomyces japonicus yFS275]|uniref:mRNA stability protein n=1 Tax=Schizosaccharomyces japonicus (strain yFS275 / FY16936) TaxID=402676 RepID=B6K3W5_SCHJY|nr:endosulphine family protein [Schizosaccharomyces japonicus yFS275]EEB08172.1 endosulphine family protein [Schizosaccharomyces japonicus yFS275]